MNSKRKCHACFKTMDELVHGNRVRCLRCAILHKRKYNRDKQRIIREVGVAGLKNYQILVEITQKYHYEGVFNTTIAKLVRLGFDFSQGGETHDTISGVHSIVMVVLHFEVYYNPCMVDDEVTIKINPC